MKLKIITIVIIVIAVAFTGWRIWSAVKKDNAKQTEEQVQLFPSINGNMVTEELANQRPITIVIENHFDARPQSGLTDAEIVYETLAEGGITRFLAIYQTREPQTIGPVRSARPYFNFLSDMWGSALAHSGGSKQALSELSAGVYKDLFDINEFFYGKSFSRDKSRFAPHNLYTTHQDLREILQDKKETDWQPRRIWETKNTPTSELVAEVTNITIPFSVPTYQVKYLFDPTTSSYQRSVGGEAHIDNTNGHQISPQNVLIQLTDISLNSDDPLLTVKIKLNSSGPCYLFSVGKFIECRWNFDNGIHNYTDIEGNPLQLSNGQTWVEIFPRDKQNLINWN